MAPTVMPHDFLKITISPSCLRQAYKGRGGQTRSSLWSPAATLNHLPMKSAVALALALAFLSTFAVASHGIVRHHRRCNTAGQGSNTGKPNENNWHQVNKGTASFTVYNGCQYPCKLCVTHFCGLVVHGALVDPRDGLLFQRAVEEYRPGTRRRSIRFHLVTPRISVTPVGAALK